jgi:hypothetical protein
MVKIYFAPNVCVLRQERFIEHEIVKNWEDCDVAIFQSTIEPNLGQTSIPLNKIIYLSLEPPIAGHRLDCYSNKDKFKLFVGWDEEDNGNRIKLSEHPEYFPWQIVPWGLDYKDKEYHKENNGIFFMSMVNAYEDVNDCFGAINITKLRRLIGTYIHDNIPNSQISGIGWPWSNKRTCYDGNWQIDKQIQIEKSGCSFVLALENVIMKNHITEKIKDGLISNKVTLYLGCPNIEEFIPTDCFVDLRQWYDKSTGDFDYEGMKNYLYNMTDEEYQRIIVNARAFISSDGDRSHYFQELTKLENKILEKLNE